MRRTFILAVIIVLASVLTVEAISIDLTPSGEGANSDNAVAVEHRPFFHFYFTSGEVGNGLLYQTVGGIPTMVAGPIISTDDWDISPDCRFVAWTVFVGGKDAHQEMAFRSFIDGRFVTGHYPVANWPGATVQGERFSPDGMRIALAAFDPKTSGYDIVFVKVYPLLGGTGYPLETTLLNKDAKSVDSFRWNANSSAVAYVIRDKESNVIYEAYDVEKKISHNISLEVYDQYQPTFTFVDQQTAGYEATSSRFCKN